MDYERAAELDLAAFESVYVCTECGDPLYRNSPSDEAICINSTCARRQTGDGSVMEVSAEAQPQLEDDSAKREDAIAQEIGRWKPGALARKTWEARRDLVRDLMDRGQAVSQDRFGALEELLILLNRYECRGHTDTTRRFERLVAAVQEWSEGLRNLASFGAHRYVFIQKGEKRVPMAMAYEHVLGAVLSSFGHVGSGSAAAGPDVFAYTHIEEAVNLQIEEAINKQLEEQQKVDWAQILAILWPFALAIRYLLESSYRSYQQHDYHPEIPDVAVILSWYMSARNMPGNQIIPADKLRSEMDDYQSRYFGAHKGEANSAEAFVSKYITSDKLVPVAVESDRGWHIDALTALFYVLYLQGKLDSDPRIDQFHPGGMLQNMRAKAAAAFEEWLREALREKGYRCLDGPLTLRANKMEFEYDIVALNESNRRVILVEAKYRDPPPSSFTGDNLVGHEFAGDDGLAVHARLQQERLEFFKEHVNRGLTNLAPESSPTSYQIDSYLVTKHIPLAHRYRETRIVRAFEFLSDEV